MYGRSGGQVPPLLVVGYLMSRGRFGRGFGFDFSLY